jgi:hypothetical protein
MKIPSVQETTEILAKNRELEYDGETSRILYELQTRGWAETLYTNIAKNFRKAGYRVRNILRVRDIQHSCRSPGFRIVIEE